MNAAGTNNKSRPSLSLASIAEAIHDAKEYGFPEVGPATFDWNTLKHKRDAYIKRLNGIYERNLEKDNVEYITGMASFISNDSVTLGNGEKIQAKKILIAVGMSSFVVYFSDLNAK